MQFEWDPEKDKANLEKHGLSFEEASELLKGDSGYLEIYDEDHAGEEDRFIAVGPIERGLVIVVYTEREDDVLRIVSARMATKTERQRFEEYERHRHG